MWTIRTEHTTYYIVVHNENIKHTFTVEADTICVTSANWNQEVVNQNRYQQRIVYLQERTLLLHLKVVHV